MDDREHGPGFVKSIYDQSVRLENLVADLLKISYAESGKERLEKGAAELAVLAGEAIKATAAAAAAKGVSVRSLVPPGLAVSADRDKIFQVLINLLDNAAKYNREGGEIKISASEEPGAVRVQVEDTGLGIAAGHLPHIFERFYRADRARSRELGGTGLGLSIVKHLVELHGGTVGVDSSEGRGSSFWFTLPK